MSTYGCHEQISEVNLEVRFKSQRYLINFFNQRVATNKFAQPAWCPRGMSAMSKFFHAFIPIQIPNNLSFG